MFSPQLSGRGKSVVICRGELLDESLFATKRFSFVNGETVEGIWASSKEYTALWRQGELSRITSNALGLQTYNSEGKKRPREEAGKENEEPRSKNRRH
jgi:hypothetical protein